MKIALIGYGKMGQAIHEIAQKKNYQVVIVDPSFYKQNTTNTNCYGSLEECPPEFFSNINVGIDFSTPAKVLKNISLFNKNKTPLVVGTSGWYQNIELVQKETVQFGNALIYATNFSVGVNLFFKLTEYAGKLINKFSQFDVSGLDIHHNQKLDSPSGTAINLGEILTKEISRKDSVVYDKLDRAPLPNEIHFASLRSGSVPGTHQIHLDSPSESINMEVVARDRSGYAEGAVVAAEWIINKNGFYKFEDLIDDIIQN